MCTLGSGWQVHAYTSLPLLTSLHANKSSDNYIHNAPCSDDVMIQAHICRDDVTSLPIGMGWGHKQNGMGT